MLHPVEVDEPPSLEDLVREAIQREAVARLYVARRELDATLRSLGVRSPWGSQGGLSEDAATAIAMIAGDVRLDDFPRWALMPVRTAAAFPPDLPPAPIAQNVGDLPLYATAEGELREFLRYIRVDGECWLWTGATGAKGHPLWYARGRKSVSAKRAALRLLGGVGEVDLPPHVFTPVCNCRACVRPEHLSGKRGKRG